MATLSRATPTLPSSWYYEAAHYAKELETIWYRDWVCVGRLADLPREGDYFLERIGTQQLIVTRDAQRLHAFHNTCRHRGSVLCAPDRGRFRNGRIVCPYHSWTYATDGKLLATPGRLATPDFREEDYSLYGVAVDAWGGFIFVNLAASPEETLTAFVGAEAENLANWPLAEMVSVQTDRSTLHCNWKVFWENYNECYHCPRIHPELCKIVEAYARGFIDYTDDPEWTPADERDDGQPVVAPSVRTWAIGGDTGLPDIPGLTEKERSAGMTFASFTGSMFIVGHPDYVRSVRVLPRGPESTELAVDWLLPPDTAKLTGPALDRMLGLGRLLIQQDGHACELNQQGLKSHRHAQGVLLPQEYYLADFHEWLRSRVDTSIGDRRA